MKREELLEKAESLVNGARAKHYGDAYENHERIAKLWSVVLGVDITVPQVYLCLNQLKVSRLIQTPDHEDSWVDIAGYAALGGERWNE
jgi:hypothetical protein